MGCGSAVDYYWSKTVFLTFKQKIDLPINLFLEQTKKHIDQICKNISHLIFGNEAALYNYGIQYLRL